MAKVTSKGLGDGQLMALSTPGLARQAELHRLGLVGKPQRNERELWPGLPPPRDSSSSLVLKLWVERAI